MDMYVITRDGEPIAGSMPVPFEAAVTAAMLLNREYRRRDLFAWELASEELVGAPTVAPAMQAWGSSVAAMVRDLGDGFLSGPRVFGHRDRDRFATTC